MKGHPLAESHLEGLVIKPSPTGCQSEHQLAILVDLHEVLEDVPGNPRPVQGVCIHNAQFPPWRGDLFPHAAAALPQGDEHEADAADDKLFHGCSSLNPL